MCESTNTVAPFLVGSVDFNKLTDLRSIEMPVA